MISFVFETDSVFCAALTGFSNKSGYFCLWMVKVRVAT